MILCFHLKSSKISTFEHKMMNDLPPKNSMYYHVMHNDKKILNDYTGCKYCMN